MPDPKYSGFDPMTWTPWGAAQSSKQWGRGVMEYTTASHGGFAVTKKRYEQMPTALQVLGFLQYDRYWFEEDICYIAVVLSFPEVSSSQPGFVAYAATRLKSYYPEIHAEWLAATVAESKLDKGDSKSK